MILLYILICTLVGMIGYFLGSTISEKSLLSFHESEMKKSRDFYKSEYKIQEDFYKSEYKIQADFYKNQIDRIFTEWKKEINERTRNV